MATKKRPKTINFAEFLGQEMRSADMTQNDLAAQLGITQPAISDWLNGKNIPRTEHWIALMQLFPGLKNVTLAR